MNLEDYLPDDTPESLTLTDHLATKTDDCTRTELGIHGLTALAADDSYPALCAHSVAKQIRWQDRPAPDMEEWTVDVEQVTHSMPATAVDTHRTLISFVPGDVVLGVDGGLRYGVTIRLLAYADEGDEMPTGLHAVCIAPEAHPSAMALAEARRYALAEHLAQPPYATILAPDGRGLTSESEDWVDRAWEGFCRELDAIADRDDVQAELEKEYRDW